MKFYIDHAGPSSLTYNDDEDSYMDHPGPSAPTIDDVVMGENIEENIEGKQM